ncbi:MAG: alpha-2-macroglobulin family protein, partial [Gemmataceae bacterium]
GQTIQYRGLCIQVDQDKDDYKVVPGQAVTVIFADHNGKEVARHAQRSNDFGSFAGSFTAPAVGATGSVSIRTEAEPFGAVSVNVEEYKRPKFLTKLEKPTKAARLNDVVHLEGKALAYTGAAVDGAPVQWRVVRQVRYPDWWGGFYWWRVPRSGVSQEIARGATVTKADGSFAIEFPARPDPSVPAKDEPTFHYLVSADVTDSAGETRSGQIDVNVGYTALKATLTAAPWQRADQPVELKIATATLDGEGQVAEGFVKVYRLKQPDRVHRKDLSGGPFPRRFGPAAADREKEPEPDPSNPASWALGEVAFESGFTTDKKGAAILKAKLGTGAYRAVLETQDRFGKKVTAKLPLDVVDPAAKALGIKVPSLFAAPTWQIEPGAEFTALWGTGYESGRAFVEVEHRGKLLQSYWTPAGQTQVLIKQAVDEAMRGGFSVRITFVRENRAYLETRQVDVPWSNKELKVRWEHFVSKLEPGHKETWTAIITGPDARKAVAEMVATLYDESLDAYLPHRWMKGFGVFRHDHSRVSSQFQNQALSLQHMLGFWPVKHKETHWTYRAFPSDLTANLREYEFGGRGGLRFAEAAFSARGDAKSADRAAADGARREGAGPPPASPTPDPASVTPRKNLSETAFFFPQLVSSEEGVVKMVFTMPEALTRWKFMGFAHDKALRSGFLEDSVVTARELMVQPYPPRFLREGDLLEFTVKVTNQSEGPLSGIVRLTLADARTDKSVDALLGNTALDQSFDIPAKESRSYAWRLKVPDDLGVLTYKAVATSGKLSDGEEGFLPVLSKRVLVTESLPLPIRGPGVKTFDFARLRASGSSDTLKHQQVVVQIVSNPAWYGVMALPYLMEFPHECTEQSFNRLYANALARHIATSDPKIRKVFEQWKGTPALDSPLEKNADLRSVLLEETPWLRQAKKESEARRNVAILFDDNRLDYELARLQRKMAELQLPDGAWSWFPSGPPNDYITLYITTGYGRLRHLGVNTDMGPALRSLERLDGWADRIYRDIRKHGKPEQNHLSPTIALYLYGRSFFLKDRPVAAGHKEAVDYFLGQARTHWLALAHRQSQGHLALALARFGDQKAAEAIMRSIKERAVSDEEMGMFWRDLERSWWWFRAPIETQALMIEAFDEVMKDGKAVEDCRVWLLKQKQTQDWKTTKATADAVYALLLRGADLLASDVLVDVTIAGMPLKAEKVEAGTGFFEKRYVGGEVNPKLGSITLKKTDEGVAWGSVNWQYLEDVSKVAAYEGTPLKLRKEIYTKVYTKKGPALQPMKGALKVGDELVVRLELRVDRDMEYVHLKDSRGSGTEPVNVLSQYRFQDGLTYYESTRDTASHFFIDYLPKGTYVFEYSTRVVHKGAYETGMAQIQCMYAPEFNSHSESFLLRVE